MKTTLELPDRLMREVKIRAAQTDRKLKDTIADLIARGLAEERLEPQPAEPDLTQFVGAHPHYKSMDEVVAYVRELRKDRDEH
ncbi:MAG: Antitoxin VapB41 [Chromatiales bacterium USCg_Taylor]|nr:MAG: Antitoxin VapB41 [Chromatiales bacterium USCg_Taylor]